VIEANLQLGSSLRTSRAKLSTYRKNFILQIFFFKRLILQDSPSKKISLSVEEKNLWLDQNIGSCMKKTIHLNNSKKLRYHRPPLSSQRQTLKRLFSKLTNFWIYYFNSSERFSFEIELFCKKYLKFQAELFLTSSSKNSKMFFFSSSIKLNFSTSHLLKCLFTKISPLITDIPKHGYFYYPFAK